MKNVWDRLLDEKIVICLMVVILASVAVLLIHWNSEKDYVMAFVGFVGTLIGALLRGITHQPDSTEKKGDL